MAKETEFLPYCLVKCIVYWTGVNVITYEKLSGVPLNVLSSVESVIGAPVLLNFFKLVAKSLAFYLFSPTRLINLIKHEHSCKILYVTMKYKVRKRAKIKNRYNQIPHLT